MNLRIGPALVAGAVVLSACSAASAFDLNGAWANDAQSCEKIFVKKGGSFAFKEKSDIYGSGFIVAGDQIRGRFARCRITKQMQSESTIHMLAACSTDIMLSNVQFSLKVVDDRSVRRLFPGMSDIEMPYARCP
jgi:hypothetical protein